MNQVGLTGNIGSGKSTIAKFFLDYGFDVIDSDKTVWPYLKKDHPVYSKVLGAFGNDILDSNEDIDRKKLARVVFNNPQKLGRLEYFIFEEYRKELKNLNRDKLWLIESAILFEKGFNKDFDLNILVYSPEEICKRRALARGMDESDFNSRWNVQMNPDDKVLLADYVIDNSGSLEDSKIQLRRFIKKYFPEQIVPYLHSRWNFSNELIFSQLVELYSGREYHNLFHIADCLGELESAKNLVSNRKELELAIWFHDSVYDSRKKDNEERSATLAGNAARELGFSKQSASIVESLIVATKHTDVPNNFDARLIMDIDLANFGFPYNIFHQISEEIRKEYSWVSDEDFSKGRRKFLSSFIARDRIYLTDFFGDKYESRARENLIKSIGIN